MATIEYVPHSMSEEQITASNTVRYFAINLDTAISDNAPDSREKSLALTKLEECVMWANKAIALFGTMNPDGLPCGLTISDDGMLLNWRGENYVKQSATLDA